MLRLATWNCFASLLSPFITFYYHLHVFNYNLEKNMLLNQSAIQRAPPYHYYRFCFRAETVLRRAVSCCCCGTQFVGSSPWKAPEQNPNMSGIRVIIVLTKQTTSKHWVCITSAHFGPFCKQHRARMNQLNRHSVGSCLFKHVYAARGLSANSYCSRSEQGWEIANTFVSLKQVV